MPAGQTGRLGTADLQNSQGLEARKMRALVPRASRARVSERSAGRLYTG